MNIQLEQVSKRFRYDWVLKKISHQFESNQSYAILGPNGSGKSTLLKMLSGHLTPSKGKIHFTKAGKKIDLDAVYRNISYAGPYIDLIEEFTLEETITFHQKFKPFFKNISKKEILEILNFSKIKGKEVRHFSSGMKQRLKLVLAICSDTSTLFLDEPTTNLDRQGFDWYKNLVNQFRENRLIIVASNVEEDYFFCQNKLSILDYK